MSPQSDCRQHTGEDLEPEVLFVAEPIRAALEHADAVGSWDVLWRMRKWVNYKEAQALLEGQDFLPYVEEFDDRLNSILTASAAVVEHVLYTLIGDAVMTEMYDSYLAVTSDKVDCSALQGRREVLCGLPF